MGIYQKYCKEVIGKQGELLSFSLDYPDTFNFGYDVVDAIANETPTSVLWYGAAPREKNISFLSAI